MPNGSLHKIGEIVKLKSGGPDMTIKQVYTSDQEYRCQWFAGKKLDNGIFPHDSLIKVEQE
ncbi:YodC family protein [Vibrio paracholerae]|uniref:YodC family protein n=1 Tax=Vibrio paracholerae TaxID=650003 RepID=UPI000DE49DE7|nr:DUF2158 domain-containing protein [Vibrio paracholerae]RBM83907.1 DUF2158 domain-containing protein [Vibrio paracholerae]